MLPKNVADLLNEQINKEFYSAYLYLEMNNYFERRGLHGFAHWYHVQALEELDHAMLIYQYLHDEEFDVKLKAIANPTHAFVADRDALETALDHEKYVTASIHAIYETALDENDFRTQQFLDWFIKEQAEEEVNAKEMLTKIDLFETDSKALYLIDRELSYRVHEAPAKLEL